MVRSNRRAILKAIGASLALTTTAATAAAKSNVETVVAIPGSKVPENLAVDDDGTLYFGITAGEVWKLTEDQTQETGLSLSAAEQVASLPGGVIGVEVAPDGTLFVASQAGGDTGVWKVPGDGGSPEPFAHVTGFPNDVLFDATHDRLLVSGSFGGLVYEVPLDATDPSTAASVWVDDDRLDTPSFGANGLTFGADGDLFVAVTRATNDAGADVGRLVRVPVESDGSAGDAGTDVEGESLFGADGITARGPHIYVAANSRNEVVRITPSKRVKTVASGDDGLVFPSDVLFGTAPRQRGDLFVCNFAISSPDDGGILRTHP